MQKIVLTVLFLITANLTIAQSSDFLIVKHCSSDRGIKNVNVYIPRIDTTLVTDTAGIIDLSKVHSSDTMIVKKFGYKSKVRVDNQREIRLEEDSMIYSHNLELLDLVHHDGYSFIKISINGGNFWFKQRAGSLYLANGLEIETSEQYVEIFKNHEIIKTVQVDAFNCLSDIKIIGENYANYITAIYYRPEVKKRTSKRIPSMHWYSKREMRRDIRNLKLEYGCLTD
jgi:hypothetical protein